MGGFTAMYGTEQTEVKGNEETTELVQSTKEIVGPSQTNGMVKHVGRGDHMGRNKKRRQWQEQIKMQCYNL